MNLSVQLRTLASARQSKNFGRVNEVYRNALQVQPGASHSHKEAGDFHKALHKDLSAALASPGCDETAERVRASALVTAGFPLFADLAVKAEKAPKAPKA